GIELRGGKSRSAVRAGDIPRDYHAFRTHEPYGGPLGRKTAWPHLIDEADAANRAARNSNPRHAGSVHADSSHAGVQAVTVPSTTRGQAVDCPIVGSCDSTGGGPAASLDDAGGGIVLG